MFIWQDSSAMVVGAVTHHACKCCRPRDGRLPLRVLQPIGSAAESLLSFLHHTAASCECESHHVTDCVRLQTLNPKSSQSRLTVAMQPVAALRGTHQTNLHTSRYTHARENNSSSGCCTGSKHARLQSMHCTLACRGHQTGKLASCIVNALPKTSYACRCPEASQPTNTGHMQVSVTSCHTVKK
jgi:hypothetical protein